MKKFAALAALLLFGVVLSAETPSGWTDDFAEAKKLAQKEKRPMLLLFTGSDWCPYCVKLHKEVLSKQSFLGFAAQKKLVLVYIDFPRHSNMPTETKIQNRQLLEEFEIKGYPTTIILDANGKEAGRILSYQKQYSELLSKMLAK